jgi:hypothetical protein
MILLFPGSFFPLSQHPLIFPAEGSRNFALLAKKGVVFMKTNPEAGSQRQA